MISRFFAAIRTVGKRMVADWLILVSAFVTIALATSLLSAGPIYAEAVTISALQRTLEDADVSESNVTANIDVFPRDFDTADEVARTALEEAFAVTGTDIFGHVVSEAFGFADQPEDSEVVDLASFQFFEAIDQHATLIDGSWPSDDAAPETAVLDAAATSLDLEVGDLITVANRRDPTIEVTVTVVGIYQPDDSADPFWFGDELALGGIQQSASFTTHGPFVISSDLMAQRFTRSRIDADWRALPHFDNLLVSEVDELRSKVSLLESRLDQDFFTATSGDVESSSPFTVTTDLDSLLNEVDRSLTVTRASVLALLIQLAILAGYALVLMAGLITDTRSVETTLLRSRGASPRQILGFSLIEALALVVPAVAAGPFVATLLLRVLNTVGPLAEIGLSISPSTTPEAFVLAAIAGALAVIALALPAYRSAREFKDARRERRQHTRTAGQRFGVDLALLAVAFVVFWQLEAIGEQITARVGGQFGVDPLLVVAPALGLLAGAVLGLRVVPLLARAAEWLASSGRSTVAALASWQVARRPVRYARSSLLLMMAIGIGFFAAAYSATWTTSQQDQAAYEIGAEIAATPNRGATAMTDFHLKTAHEDIEGVNASMPVVRQVGPVTRSGELGQFMQIDATSADEVVLLREDIGSGFGPLLDTLAAARPTMAGFALPGEPSRIGLTFEAVEELPEQPWPPDCDPELEPPDLGACFEPPPLFQARVRAVLQDGDERLHRVDLGFIPVNDGVHRLMADLTYVSSDGTVVSPTYPLRLVNIEIQNHLPPEPRTVELRFGGISTFDSGWEDLEEGSTWGDWLVGSTSVIGAVVNPSIQSDGTTADGDLVLNLDTGAGFGVAPSYFSLRVIGTELPEAIPIVVSDSFLVDNEASVGDELRLTSLGIVNDLAVIVGSVSAFPSVDVDRLDAIIVDLPTVQTMGYEPGRTIAVATEYWLDTDGDNDPVVSALSAPPLQSFKVESTTGQAATRASDPVALGTIGALTVGFVAAAVFASVGFAVSATVSARERLVEFGLLRALGLSPRQLATWLFLEQGALVIVSLALGTLIGVVLTATILPLITLTQDGSTAFPPVIVEYPWTTVLALEAAVIVVLGAIVTLMTVGLRRVGLGGLLRMGED